MASSVTVTIETPHGHALMRLARVPVADDFVAVDHWRGETWHVAAVTLLPVGQGDGSVAIVHVDERLEQTS